MPTKDKKDDAPAKKSATAAKAEPKTEKTASKPAKGKKK